MTLEMLKKIDKDLVSLDSGSGQVFIVPGLQGRIFCSVGSDLVHKFDAALALHPHSGEFNNIGGNSLWPAPEGGEFAFNYPPEGGWMVQPGINSACPQVIFKDNNSTIVNKDIILKNRKGVSAGIRFARRINVNDISEILSSYGLEGVAYRSEDSLKLLDSRQQSDFIISAWSLEQFPLNDGTVAFGRTTGEAVNSINDDFYGSAASRITYDSNLFIFKLGGNDRIQIGVNVKSKPQFIGSYDVQRSLLIIRKTVLQDGVYFNIADNEQKHGAYSATDAYSIFNGGALGFYELETIAPMHVENGIVKGSSLHSETVILKGAADKLKKFLARSEFNINAELIIN